MDYARTTSEGHAWTTALATVWLAVQRCPQCGGEPVSLAETGRDGVLRLWCVNQHWWQDSPVRDRITDIVQDRPIVL